MKFKIRKYLPSILFFIVFEAIAIILWLTKNNLFYLFNFSYENITRTVNTETSLPTYIDLFILKCSSKIKIAIQKYTFPQVRC